MFNRHKEPVAHARRAAGQHRSRHSPLRFARIAGLVAALVALPAAGAATTGATSTTNLVPNPSFESSLSGWSGYDSTLSRVTGGADGAWSASVKASRNASWTISPTQRQVSATVAGAAYTATAWVRLRSGSRTVCLKIREWSGQSLVSSAEQCLVPSSSWKAIAPLKYTARHTGSSLDLYAFGRDGRQGNAFDIDAVSLTSTASSPATPSLAVSLTSPSATAVAGTVNVAATVTSGTAARVEFLADGTLVGSDTTSPYSVDWNTKTRGDGTASLVARAVGASGATATSTARTISIDNTAPETSFTSAPSGILAHGTADVAFTAGEAATFECALNGGAWSACTSPRLLTGLVAGTQTFLVRATDALGNVDATPATATWVVALSTTPAPSGSAYYVSPAGSDSNPGTFELPWKTLAKAFATVGPGQTAYLRAGNYVENTGVACGSGHNAIAWTRSGTASAPITISGYPGEEERVIVGTMLKLYGSHLKLTRLVVERNSAHSNFDNACTGSVGIQVGGDDIVLEGLDVRNGRMSGIYLDNADRTSIVGNLIRNNGAHSNLDHGIYYGTGVGGTIANNIISGNLAYGIQMYPSPRGQLITHNVVVGNGKAGMILSGASDVVVANNISAYNAEQGIRTYDACTGCRADQNVIFGNPRGDYYLPSPLTVGTTIRADPRFVDRTSGDYRLGDGSPAIDVAHSAYTVSEDFLGQSRPASGGPDVGAYER